MDIANSFKDHRQRLCATAQAAGRKDEDISLMAVSKYHSEAAVEQALETGHRLFGENRVQEAKQKFPALKARYPDLRLHLIGPLQTNKVKDIFGLFDSVDSLDRPKLAEALAKARDEKNLTLPNLMVQINIGEEPQKAGILPQEADAFLEDCRDRLALPIKGLMCIPPVGEEPSLYFALLREIAKRHQLDHLSMGMSADFECAIQFGATMIRIGTALFGER